MNIGFLGLGVMGSGMAANLIKKSGCAVYGFDPVPEILERFSAKGGVKAHSVSEIAGKCDVIAMCLPTNDIVRSTLEELIETAAHGSALLDMGASSPNIIRELFPRAKEKGIDLLDCPVSGGTAGAEAGTLAIMCGGERGAFERIRPILEMMGGNVTYVGGPGCGDVAKIANNMIVNIGLLTIGEAYAFAKKAGIDARTLFEATKGGVAETAIMNLRAPLIFEHRFVPATGRTVIGLKDANNGLELARELGVELPLTEMLAERLNWMVEQGMGDWDHSAIIKWYEQQMGVTIE